MTNEKKEQDIRARFYTGQSVARYIRANGVPKSRHAFRNLVASSTSEMLDGEKGLELIARLGHVVFAKHPQQINFMVKSNGKWIAAVTR